MKWSCPECGSAVEAGFWPTTEDHALCSQCQAVARLHEHKIALYRALNGDRGSAEPDYASKDLLPALVAVVRRLLAKEIDRTNEENRRQRQSDERLLADGSQPIPRHPHSEAV